ncbi:MAG: ADP-ribosylglycohydrolase family protein [Cytophagales bacterium]|nr:ADP-ribosylglycohydrolase family protein [Cytophagales bacterium]
MKYLLRISLMFLVLSSCQSTKNQEPESITISRSQYKDQLYGFWLGQCIANWTGLVTEMDKIGNIGEVKTGPFYTREDWGKPDFPNIWSDSASDLSPTIDFVLRRQGEVWGADDDTDIEYIYQHLLYTHQTTQLTGEQIRDGWLKHIKAEEENYLWVSNQKAFDLMQTGLTPPATSDPANNEHYDMIDAQLTTEIFGLFSPTQPEVALKMAHLPIRTSAQKNAAQIAEFYVVMHSLASTYTGTTGEQLMLMAEAAKQVLKPATYPIKMYDYVKAKYDSGIPWEQTRDSVYIRYQVEQQDGYDITGQNLYCNGCFAAGINFAASLISLFYGEGDLKETIKIGTLTGWDSDNPTATWGGLIGFMIGKEGVEKAFGDDLSNQFNIHRTRQNFPNEGIDTFEAMAQKGIEIVDRVVKEEMAGELDLDNDQWIIPQE